MTYDETDDSYTVIDGPGYEYHDHIPSLYVFAPSLSCAALSSETIQGLSGES